MPRATVTPSRSGLVDWPPSTAAHYRKCGHWEGRDLASYLYAAADAEPDRVCLVDGDVRMSYRELIERADAAAIRLRSLGLRPDDRIVLALPNCWEFVAITVACLRIGVLPVMALPTHRHGEIAAVAAHAEAAAIVVTDVLKGFDHQGMARAVADEVPTVDHVIVLGDTVTAGHIDLTALLAPGDGTDGAREALDRDRPDSGAVALFLLSGGTTGAPKLVARTHDDYAYMVRRSAELCRFDRDTVYLGVLPLAHGYPMAGPGILGALFSGGRVVIAPSPAPERAFAVIAAERVTAVSLVPAAVQRWLEYAEYRRPEALATLRLMQVAAARLADTVAARIPEIFGCHLQQVYGMSEGLLCMTRLDDPDDVLMTTQGRPICPDDELRVVDEHGLPVPPGVPGVLLTRGPYTPRGYYRAADLTAAVFVDGWYRTGDIVRLRPDGNLVIEGRDKDVINRGGEKIPAEEVEQVAYATGTVRFVAAVAMPDPQLGERICLYVVPVAGVTVDLAAIQDTMRRAGLAHFKLPEHLIVVESLPMTPVGKVDKLALRADIDRRLADPTGATPRT